MLPYAKDLVVGVGSRTPESLSGSVPQQEGDGLVRGPFVFAGIRALVPCDDLPRCLLVTRQVCWGAEEVQLAHRGVRDRGPDGPRGRREVQDDASRDVHGEGPEEGGGGERLGEGRDLPSASEFPRTTTAGLCEAHG